MPRQLKVFLTHASGDKPVVRELYLKLKRDGFRPWLDEEDLIAGQVWSTTIRKTIEETDVVVFCLSKQSITKEGFIQKEMKQALDLADEKPEGTIFFIPIRLDDCEVPYSLKRWHWVDFFEPNGYEKLVRALSERCKTLIDIGSVDTDHETKSSAFKEMMITSWRSRERSDESTDFRGHATEHDLSARNMKPAVNFLHDERRLATTYFEPKLVPLGLGEKQIAEQSIDQLKDSLNRIDKAIENPDAFGIVRLGFLGRGSGELIIVRSATDALFHVGILPILLERKKLIAARIRGPSQSVAIKQVDSGIDNQSYAAPKDVGESKVTQSVEQAINSVSTNHVVILVHGIRDFALWQTAIRSTLEEGGFRAEATNYGRFNLLEFLAPFSYFRKKAIDTVWNQIRIIKQNNEGALLSVVAHSFGTFVVSHLMQNNFDVRFHRVIFCGSVVRYGFPFEQFQNRFSAPIVNEVGTRDIWPAIAESVTFGYGSAGTYGFRRPLVRDRWHNKARHGYFLSAEFCKTFWQPFLKNGTFVGGAAAPESPRVWLQILSIVKIKYLLISVVLVAIVYAVPIHFSEWLPCLQHPSRWSVEEYLRCTR
jgi:hypothetical protein